MSALCIGTATRYERQRQPYPKLAGFQEELERLIAENDRPPRP